jgi:spoIIIJ-associated protein
MATPAKEILENILKYLGFNATVTETTVDGAPLLQVESDDAGRLIGREGKTLSSLQFIVNRILYSIDPTAPKVTVDVAHYREKARESLAQKAREAAEKVRRWGEPIELGPLNSYDRWVIHQTLKNEPDIETYSIEVEGTDKKAVVIRLKK